MKINGQLNEIEFYSDPINPTAIYAEVVIPGDTSPAESYELFVDINDERLKSYIRLFVLGKNSSHLQVNPLLQNAKDIISLYGNPDQVSPRIRTAGTLRDGLIEYDLANRDRQYVRITPQGWTVTKDHQNKFLKKAINSPQVTPTVPSKDLLTLLKPYVNASADDRILFAAWLVQAFCESNHSALLITADRGCGKSTLTKMVRTIIDPSMLKPEPLHPKMDDLITRLTTAYFVAFDNIDGLSKAQSDLFCSAVSGANTSKRALYTTNELVVYELHNTLVFNGIDIVPAESDLADRCLLLKLRRIDEGKRKTDRTIKQKFEQDLPEIMGAIFSTLSEAMRIFPTITLTRMPRMADAYLDMLAIAMALGVSQAEFEEIYFGNLQALDKARADIAIIQAVHEYMTSGFVTGRVLEGTMTEVYNRIKNNYSGSPSDLPKSSSHFSRKLHHEYNALYAAGYTVNIDNTSADSTRIKIIKN